MSEVLLQATRLSVDLAGRTVLDGVAFTVAAGEVIAVVGTNGAGKTTLLRACAGLLPEATGELTTSGLDPRETAPQSLADRRAYAPQHPTCAWDFTVAELGTLSSAPTDFTRWLERFGLRELADRRLSALSGGERKLAHLCLTFSALGDAYGKGLLLDEPTTALDLCRAELVARAIRASAQAGAAVLVATHDLAWARTADRVIVLSEGRVVSVGPPSAALTAELVRETWGVA
ncbi:MAG: ATP-binding cassette domain-containing protein [Verrucomicrobia bacterium]|jgi:iron complex transport system ATP-binding protein|nr:ATP-binding cassette domain-containing protein [Verrucomicrobiota bacterium]